jgi:hypothetical protein
MSGRMVYEWLPSAHVDLDAQVVGAHLEDIKVRAEDLTPAVVVQDAQIHGSPLHPFFEWDDRVAASKHREDQAPHRRRHQHQGRKPSIGNCGERKKSRRRGTRSRVGEYRACARRLSVARVHHE